jgi:hypothetical protein
MSTATEPFLSTTESFLSRMSDPELSSLFKNSQLWSLNSEQGRQMLRILGKHSHDFFSPLRTLFLFEIKSLEALSYFSPVLVRDGALTLLHFFYKYPEPTNPQGLILVHHRLRNLIPHSWRPHFLTYDITSTESSPVSQLLLIPSMFGPRQCRPKYVSETITAALKITAKGQYDITCCPIAAQNQEDYLTLDRLTAHYSELMIEICNNSRRPAQVIKHSELESKDFSGWNFLDLNEYNYFYSHSYLEQFLLNNGAKPLLDRQNFEPAFLTIPLSFYSRLKIYKLSEDLSSIDQSKHIQQALEAFAANPITSKEESEYKPMNLNFYTNICCQSFQDFAFHLAQEFLG